MGSGQSVERDWNRVCGKCRVKPNNYKSNPYKMLTGSTSTQEQNEIYARLRDGPSHGEKEIRVCIFIESSVIWSTHHPVDSFVMLP